MDIATTLSGAEKARLDAQVEAFNTELNGVRPAQQNLNKDDFLKILITQLQHQDPTNPLEDREFIAQMAQFSSLEQMTNLSTQFTELSGVLKSAQALDLIGRRVEIVRGDLLVQGTVEAATGGPHPQLLVNGTYYDYNDISKVTDE